jgi:putative transposase
MEVHRMTDMMSGVENAEDSKPETGLDGLDKQLVEQLVSRAKAGGLALTDVGPVEVTVPRDRNGGFEPKLVAKRQKRLTGMDEMVISLAAKGPTTGEISAHLAEVHGAEVSRQTIHVKIRDGQVANRPIYVALAVTCEGRRDILGLGGRRRWRGCRILAACADRTQEPRRRRCVTG